VEGAANVVHQSCGSSYNMQVNTTTY